MSVILKKTSSLLHLVMPYAKGCPDFVAEKAIRFAAIDFAERSRAWRHLVEVEIGDEPFQSILTGEADGAIFDLLFTINGNEYQATTGTFPQGGPITALPVATIHEFEFAEFNGNRLDPVQFTTMESSPIGKPRYITQVSPGTVALIPFSAGRLRMSMFLKPTTDSEFGTDPANPLFDRFNMVPDFFVTMHGNTLAAGALARILSIPEEPWTNEQKSVMYRAEFDQKLAASFRWNMRGQQRAPIRTRFRDM